MIQKKWSKVKLGKDCKTRRNAQIITDNFVHLFLCPPLLGGGTACGGSGFNLFRPCWRSATFPKGEGHLGVGNFRRLQLRLELVSDQGNKLTVGGFSPKENVGATIGRPLVGIGIWGRRAANGRPYGEKLEIRNLAGLQLKLQFVRNQGDEFGIRRFTFRIADGIAEEPLKGIQIPSVPGRFEGMPDGLFHSVRGGLNCFHHQGHFCAETGVLLVMHIDRSGKLI